MGFRRCAAHRLGAEIELQLLDATTLDLADGIIPLIEFYPASTRIKPDLIQSCVELCTPVCADSSAAVRTIAELLDPLQARCEELGMALAGAGTHAFGERLALITPIPRYQTMGREHGYLRHHQITFAMHLHVGMRSGDEAIRVMRRLTPCLPALLALAANSPFWRGYDTKYACYRQRILASSRLYGRPAYFEDWRDFQAFFTLAQRTGTIRTIRDIHWDIRPHPDFGTLELRVMDCPSSLATIAMLMAFVRCLVVHLADASDAELDGRLPSRLPDWMEADNYHRASHRGLEAEVIADETGRASSLREQVNALLDLVRPTATKLGELPNLLRLETGLLREPGYAHQRELDWRQSSHFDVMDGLRQDLLARPAELLGTMPRASGQA
jgi:carboxylate-amine ligase